MYKATLDKVNKTCEVLHADPTNQKAKMTITLAVNTHLGQQFEDKIVPGMGVFIEYFDIAPKSEYDKGDCDYILVLKDTSTVEKINSTCNQYNFIPNSTIQTLLNNTSNYPIGTVGALVVGTLKQGNVNFLEIKGGQSEEDYTHITSNK